jgi:hypothetical protein
MRNRARRDAATGAFERLFVVEAPSLREAALQASKSLDPSIKYEVWQLLAYAQMQFWGRPENLLTRRADRLACQAELALTRLLRYIHEPRSAALLEDALKFVREVLLGSQAPELPPKELVEDTEQLLTRLRRNVDDAAAGPLLLARDFLRDRLHHSAGASSRRPRGRAPMPYAEDARDHLKSLGVSENSARDLIRGVGIPLRPPRRVRLRKSR